MTGISTLQKRIADSDRTASDPLSAPGVAQQLNTISEGLNRQFQSSQADAMSRAAQTGQAGLAGAMAQTSAQLSVDLANTRAKTQADTLMEVYNKARQEGMDATSALAAAQNEVARIKNERSRIDADMSAQEAELNQRAEEAYRDNLMDQALLAEEARQFDDEYDLQEDGADLDLERFDQEKRLADQEYGFRQRQESRQRELDSLSESRYKEEKEDAKRREKLGVLDDLYDKELLDEGGYMSEMAKYYEGLPRLYGFGSGGYRRDSLAGFGSRYRRRRRP